MSRYYYILRYSSSKIRVIRKHRKHTAARGMMLVVE